MLILNSYKVKKSFNERHIEASRIRSKYPDRIPIICEKTSELLNDLDKFKYLVPTDLTIGHFMYVIRKKLSLHSSEALYLFCNGRMMSCSTTIGSIYDEYKDSDGFLYFKYSKENTFG
jgi:GABA(A) receptor-associated protein